MGLSGGPDSVALTDGLAALRAARLPARGRAPRPRPAPRLGRRRGVLPLALRPLGVPLPGGRRRRARPRPARAGRDSSRPRGASGTRSCGRVRRRGRRPDRGRATRGTTRPRRCCCACCAGPARPGLAGMRAGRGGPLRPLLEVSRATCSSTCAAGLRLARGSARTPTRVHLRNRVRHELLPYLGARFNPRVREALARDGGAAGRRRRLPVAARPQRLLARASGGPGAALVLRSVGARAGPCRRRPGGGPLAAPRTGGLRRLDAYTSSACSGSLRSAAPAGGRLPLPGGRDVRFTADSSGFEKSAPPAGKPYHPSPNRR